jgi:hypothetical protein
MTKTWNSVLAAVLALTAWPVHAAEPPQFSNLPPANIQYTYTPPDTKAPANLLGNTYLPPSVTPATPAPASPANDGHDSWFSNSWFGGGTLGCCSPGGCGERSCDLKPACSNRSCGEKLKAWLCYRAHWTGCECCCWCRPPQPGYTYFLYLGCREGNCGGCCNGAASCGCANGACSGK